MVTRSFGLLAAILAVLASSAPAEAVPGDVVGQSCISKTGAGGCASLAQPSALEVAAGVVVAPDGTDVDVGAGAGIAHFRRAPDGSLTYANCVDTASSSGDRCPETEAPPDAGGALSANSINIAISPDGKHVYAVSWVDALLWWTRDPATGDLSWGGCRDAAIDSSTNGRCGAATTFGGGNFPAGSMAYAQGISVTADGQTIYIADQSEGLLQAQRNASTGAATPTACFNTTGSAAAGCTSLASGIPMALSGIDVASNSRDVYVRSISPGGVTHFSRTAGGTTSFASCVGSLPCGTSAPSPVFAYSGSLGVAGDVLFTHGGNYGTPSGTAARFGRDADGSLTYETCATTEAAPGSCAVLPAQTSGGSIGRLAVSPDADSVYLPQSGTTEKALTRLTGTLGFASCLSSTGVAACASPPLPGPFGNSVGQMVVSPDGRQIYQAASDAINVFDIEQVATGGQGPGSSTPVPSTKRPRATPPRIRSVKRVKKGRYRVKVRVFQAGKIRARFTGKLKRKGKVRTLGKVAVKRVRKPSVYTLIVKPSRIALERKLKAKLVVSISPPGFVPARKSRRVRL
jgi:hypothetical protein